MGEHEYADFYANEERGLDYSYLVQLIVKELKDKHPQITAERSIDFSNKVDNSFQKLALFLEHSDEQHKFDYLTSEQSLLYGHPFHPVAWMAICIKAAFIKILLCIAENRQTGRGYI